MTGQDPQWSPDKKLRFWQVHIKAWKKSGLSQREYSDKSKISSSQFCYWKTKFKKEEDPPVSFVPVPVLAPTSQHSNVGRGSESGLTILLKNGTHINIGKDFAEATLLRLLTTLGGCS